MALLDSTKSGIEQDVEELTDAVCSCVAGSTGSYSPEFISQSGREPLSDSATIRIHTASTPGFV